MCKAYQTIVSPQEYSKIGDDFARKQRIDAYTTEITYPKNNVKALLTNLP